MTTPNDNAGQPMTKEMAAHIILYAAIDAAEVTDDANLWNAIYMVCPHAQYRDGGSAGQVCSMCGAVRTDEGAS